MGHMGKGVSCVLKIEMGYLGGWAMGHMGSEDRDGAHGHCGHVLDHVQLP